MQRASSLAVIVAFVFSLGAPAVSARADVATQVEIAAQRVQTEFDRLEAALKRAAQGLGRDGLIGDPARQALSQLCASVSYAVDCAAVSPAGRMVTVEPAAFRSFEGKDISQQEQVKRVMETGRPAMSALFQSVEGVPAIDIEYPVFTADRRQIGSVSILIYPERLLGGVIGPLAGPLSADQSPKPTRRPQPPTLSLWAMDINGTILYDADPREIGLNLFTSEVYRRYTSLITLGKRIARDETGAGSYEFLRDASEKEVVKKEARWKTASLFGTAWRVVGTKSP